MAWLARGDWAPERSADFAVDAPSPVRESTASWPAVAFDGTRYWAVLGAYSPVRGIWGTRVDANGGVLDAPGKLLAADDQYSAPSVAGYANRSLAAWTTTFADGGRAVRAVRLEGDGTVLDTTPLAIADVPSEVVPGGVGAGAPGYLVAWQRPFGDAGSVVAVTRVGRDGTVLDVNGGLPVPTAAVVQKGAAVAGTGGDMFLAAWYASTNDGGTEIEAARFSWSAGTSLDAVHIDLGDTGQARVDQVAATYGGQDFWVAWTGREISVGRVSTGGAALDLPSGVPLSATDGGSPAVAVTPDGDGGVLVAFSLEDPTGYQGLLGGARVDPNGNPVDAVPLVLWSSEVQALPTGRIQTVSAARGNAGQLFAWQGYITTVELLWSLEWQAGASWTSSTWVGAARRLADGSLPDPVALRLLTGASWEYAPAAAVSGSGYFVAWADSRGRDTPLQQVLSGTRISLDGRVLDSTALPLSDQTFALAPAVGSNGTDYLVAWAESPAAQVFEGTDSGIRGLRVSAAGQVLDAAPLAINTTLGSMTKPRIAFDGTSYVVAWMEAGYNLVDGTVVAVPFVRLVRPDGTMPQGSDVTLGGSRGAGPLSLYLRQMMDATFDGRQAWVGWQDLAADGGAASLKLVRLNAGGDPIDSPPIELARGPIVDGPVLASRGDGITLAAWTFGGRSDGGVSLVVARLRANGDVLDPSPEIVAQGSVSTIQALGADGGFLLAWDDRSNPARVQSYARWIGPGLRLTPAAYSVPFPIDDDAGTVYAGSAAFAGDTHDHTLRVFSHYDPTPGVAASRVRASLVSFPDAGVVPPVDVGCGCQSGNAPFVALALLLLVLRRIHTPRCRRYGVKACRICPSVSTK